MHCQMLRVFMSLQGILLQLLVFILVILVQHGQGAENAAAVEEIPARMPVNQQQQQLWDHNYSCIFDNYRTFSYLHIGYVSYFNVSNKAPTFCTLDNCLDTCTADCSCSAIVFDVPRDSCYQYHDYIPVQTIQLLPVMPHDTISAYIKVQRGYHRYYYSGGNLRRKASWVLSILATIVGILVY